MFLEVASTMIGFFLDWWFIVAPIALFFIFTELWLDAARTKYVTELKWVLLDIKIPREVEKTPKAMEGLFTGLHAVFIPLSFKEKWFQGRVQLGFSMEFVSVGGEVHFIIGVPEQNRHLIEAQVYAQYRSAEIHQIEDYTIDFPESLPNEDYDMTGGEIILAKEDAYPIRTYTYFEDERAKEEKRIDPIGPLLEYLSSLDPREKIFIHFMITPVGEGWKKEGEKVLARLLGRKSKSERHSLFAIIDELVLYLLNFMDTLVHLLVSIFTSPFEGEGEIKEKREEKKDLSSGERTIIEAIENNISKLGFETGIRFLYIAPREIFSRGRTTGIMGGFKQFNTLNLNGFKIDKDALTTDGKFVFKKRRGIYRKKEFLDKFKKRKRANKTFVLNTEELATVYHFPGVVVTAPTLPRVGAKKGEPPVNLPL